jgi:hypothetical protein
MSDLHAVPDLRPASSGTVDELLPVNVEVTLAATGPIGRRDGWGDEILAERVNYAVNRYLASGRIVVSVTLYSASGIHNHTWYDPRHYVADGLDAGAPPDWVPDAPEWFWNAVEDMAAGAALAGALS